MADFRESQTLLIDGVLGDAVTEIAAAGYLAHPVRVVTKDGAHAALISAEQAQLLNQLVLQQATAGQRPLTDAELADFLEQPPHVPETEAGPPAQNPHL
ncbi:hypothetical protein AB0J43_01990 [Nonomuraea fuscirosea]